MNIRQMCDAAVTSLQLLPASLDEGRGVDLVFRADVPDSMMMIVRLEVDLQGGAVTVSVQILTESMEPLMTEAQVEGQLAYTTFDELFAGLVDDEEIDEEEAACILSAQWRQGFRGDSVPACCDVYGLDQSINGDGEQEDEGITPHPLCVECVAAAKAAVC